MTTRTALLLVVAIGLLAPAAAAQGEEYVAGSHVFSFRFQEEPWTGIPQTLVIDVLHEDSAIPVGGLETTLTLTVVFGERSRQFPLVESEERVGRYLARFVPTAPGSYTARLEGEVRDERVEVVAELPPVRDASDLRFPPVAPGPTTPQEGAAAPEGRGVPAPAPVAALAAIALTALALRGGRRA